MNVDTQDKVFMRRAIKLAKQGAHTSEGSPIGCVIVLNNDVIGETLNEVEALFDPTRRRLVVQWERRLPGHPRVTTFPIG